MKNKDLQYQYRSYQYDVYTKFGLIVSIVLKKLSKNQILTSIKDCNPVSNLQNNDLCQQRRSCQ